MLIEPIGGLCNRIRVILAAIIYCEHAEIDLDINWVNNIKLANLYNSPNKTMRVDEVAGGHFTDVFLHNTLSKKIKINFVGEKDHVKESYIENNLPNFYRGTNVSIFKNSISDFKKIYLQMHKRLRLVDELQNQVDDLAFSTPAYNSIHIRRTDLSNWLKSRNRNVTALSKFENFIIKKSDEHVFLATDCVATRNYLVKKYPTQIFYQGSLSEVDRPSQRPSSLQQAATDIFLCVRSKEFLGTKESSFSDLIKTLRRVM